MASLQLTEDEKKQLLDLAREVITARLENRQARLPRFQGALLEPCGAFVTLHHRGRLRGCIGQITPRLPLSGTVGRMALEAAFHDPRFPSLSARDWGETDLEISVLSPLRRCLSLDEIEVGTHGLYLTLGSRSGLLLPQVAVEQGWDRETFLVQTCYKAGLPAEAYKSPEAVIEIFCALVFGEK
jgi:AmmeMemoRadiSam system protein A